MRGGKDGSVPDLNKYIDFLKIAPPPAPSQIISPSQIARRYRSLTYGIEYRAGLWEKRDSNSFARAFLAGDPTLCREGPELNGDFWKRFMELPGEGKSTQRYVRKWVTTIGKKEEVC
jgi:hypothetical protein